MLIGPQNLPENIERVRDLIARAAAQCGRSVDSVTLIAVSKSVPAEIIEAAARAGLRHFGESYLQEALEKMSAVPARDLIWHFIGGLQANKTRLVAENFAWVHSVDRLRIAERLSNQRPYHAPLLNVCIQVNVGGELSKGGASPSDVPDLVAAIGKLPRLKLRGLMCLPPEEDDPTRQRHWFAQLRELYETLNQSGAALDTLSMGMSGDFQAAIMEGATLVRVGTALFGARTHTMRPE
jgi:pyridoxal phosphate enzyme (YggS family)